MPDAENVSLGYDISPINVGEMQEFKLKEQL
jgi:hypothetical protein